LALASILLHQRNFHGRSLSIKKDAIIAIYWAVIFSISKAAAELLGFLDFIF